MPEDFRVDERPPSTLRGTFEKRKKIKISDKEFSKKAKYHLLHFLNSRWQIISGAYANKWKNFFSTSIRIRNAILPVESIYFLQAISIIMQSKMYIANHCASW